MKRSDYIRWVIEFLSVTFIAIILAFEDWSNALILIPIGLIICAKIQEYRTSVTDRQLRVKEQLKVLMKLLSYESELNVRCTYHVRVGKNQLLQTFDYLPNEGGGGRKFPIEKGIIGKVYVDKGPKAENFADDNKYREKMISEYHYTEQELKCRTADRRSYFCYPLVDETHNVLGLIYFDSSCPNTFIINNCDQRVKMIMDACETIKSNLL